MKSDIVLTFLLFFTLALGGAMEELAPKILGVGFPVLLTAAMFHAPRRSLATMAIFVIAAGAMEDALSGLPLFSSIAFFALAASAARWLGHSVVTAMLAYPAYQVWLWTCCSGLDAGLFNRLLVSVPVGLAAIGVLWPVFGWLEERGALNGGR